MAKRSGRGRPPSRPACRGARRSPAIRSHGPRPPLPAHSFVRYGPCRSSTPIPPTDSNAPQAEFAPRGTRGLSRVAETEAVQASLRRVRTAPDGVSALDAWVQHEATYHARILGVADALEHVGHADPQRGSLAAAYR